MSGAPRVGRRLIAIVGGLATVEAILVAEGGRWPGPVLRGAGRGHLAWTGGSDPASVVIGLVHAVAVVGLAYLLVAGLIEGLAHLGRAGGRRPGLAARLPGATSVVQRAAGVGLALSLGAVPVLALEPAGAVVPSPLRAPVVMHLERGPAPPVMHLVPPATAPTHRLRTPSPARTPAVWTIRPGDHLWKVAGLTLATAWGHPADDAAILTYVDAIVQVNQAVFVVPGHPDLVYPGQRFALPPLPPPA